MHSKVMTVMLQCDYMEPTPSKAPHVLNASTNLVGFSFILLTSLKFFKLTGSAIVSELVAIIVVGFILSCTFSFFSMRSKSQARSDWYETIADYIFLIALMLLLIVCLLLTLTY